MKSTDLDPDALATRLNEKRDWEANAKHHDERMKALRTTEELWMRRAGKAEATVERLELALREAIDTLKGLAKDNPWAEWVAVPMIVGDETVVSRLEAALTAREPGVTGKGEGEK